MQHVTYGIRAWNNTSDRKCYQCGKILGESYIRVNSYYFCPMTKSKDEFSADCFSTWAVNKYPNRVSVRAMVQPPKNDLFTDIAKAILGG